MSTERVDATLAATVVIPTLDPGPGLAEVLDRVTGQRAPGPFEVLVVDSSSKDGTVALLEQRGIRHLVIAQEDFNHGLTRNLGVREARGGIVVFLSQDALPEPGWLAGLLAAFDDPEVAGAYSRQVPRPDASPFAVDQLSHWPASSPEPRRQVIVSRAAFEALALEEKLAIVCFDNVSSAVRRSVASAIPFRDLSFGEDRDWAYRALIAGHLIEYCPTSTVVHSHDRSFLYGLRRTFADHRQIRELLEPPGDPPAVKHLIAGTRAATLRLLDVASRAATPGLRMKARLRAPLRALEGSLGHYLALRSVGLAAGGSRTWNRLQRWLAKEA